MNVKKLLNVGLINTFRMNLYYLGFKSLINPRIIVSKNVKIKELKGKVEINGFGRVDIGFGDCGLVDKKYQRTSWQNSKNGRIEFKGNCCLGPGTKIVNNGKLVFGENFAVTANSSIVCFDKIEFGRDNLISWECSIMDTDFHKIVSLDDDKVLNENRSIKFGDRVWMCSNCYVLKGVTITDDIVIAKGSIVTKSLTEKNTIYKDNTIAKQNIRWEI